MNPTTVWRFASLVAFAGAVATVAITAGLPLTAGDGAVVAAFVALAFLSGLIPLRFHRGGDAQGFNFEGAVFVGMLISVPIGLVPAVMVAASIFTHAVRRPLDPRKLLFNPGKTGLEMSAGTLVFWVLAGNAPAITSARTIGAVVAAAIVYELVSGVVMAELFRTLEGTPRGDTLAEVGRVSGLTFLGNTAFGILLAALATVGVAFVLLSGVVLLGLYLGYRGYAAALDAQRRAEALNETTHLLLDLPGTDDAAARLLERLTEVLGATSADLVLETDEGVRRWRRLADSTVQEEQLANLRDDRLLATAMSRNDGVLVADLPDLPGGARDAIAAPITRQGRPHGVIALHGRRGLEAWDRADAKLLAAVAAELAVALDNVALFEQLEQERSRLESESTKLSDILGAASDGITLIRDDGAISSWNPAMERITGVPRHEAVTQPWFVVLRLRDEDGRELLPAGPNALTRALAGQRRETPVALQVLRRDGDWRWLSCTTAPIAGDGHGGVVLVARDVTAEREVEELKADFVATVSHELRTPMTPLKGFLGTLRERADSLSAEQLVGVHDAMATQVTRLETLIADLLAVAELEHGKFDVRPEPVPLEESVRSAAEVEATAGGHDRQDRIRVVTEQPVRALADPVALLRVVRALVGNALKHTEGAVDVVVGADGDRAFVRVVDEGPGIPPWEQQRIFGRFERLGDHLRRTQGPGLGLTIARSLAHRMHGDIAVDSDVDRGSAFTLWLPRAQPRPVRSPAVAE